MPLHGKRWRTMSAPSTCEGKTFIFATVTAARCQVVASVLSGKYISYTSVFWGGVTDIPVLKR